MYHSSRLYEGKTELRQNRKVGTGIRYVTKSHLNQSCKLPVDFWKSSSVARVSPLHANSVSMKGLGDPAMAR